MLSSDIFTHCSPNKPSGRDCWDCEESSIANAAGAFHTLAPLVAKKNCARPWPMRCGGEGSLEGGR